MGDRCELSLKCAYCDSWNEDVWYAPTCSSDTFACKNCGKFNFIKDTVFEFEAKKVEDVKYEEVEIGFINTTNVTWTDEDVKRMCKERHNSIINENKNESRNNRHQSQ